MSSIYLFSVVAQHNHWLSVRQATIAGNIANANTPGFKALDVAPFEAALQQARLSMTTSNPGHMTAAGAEAPAVATQRAEPWETTHSGNNVSLEQELINSGDVARAFRLNTSVVKTFHRMLLSSAKV
jgi:flagellar basal-body rod protein FlgB